MNLIGQDVSHIKFGKGNIISISDSKIEVEFALNRKKFSYPEVFKKFITLQDKTSQEYIDGILDELDRTLNIELERKEKEMEHLERIRSLKVHANSQAAFGFLENDLDGVVNTWSVFTGRYLSGNSKGQPRIPKKLNINSVCLLTMKPEGLPEEKRLILGAFMVPDDFIGSLCKTGIIYAHEKHRIILEKEHEHLLFWDYFSSKDKGTKWGNCEFKYLSNITMQRIVRDITKLIQNTERREKAVAFYHYFCEINQLQYEEI